jgi:hypothetical protein
MKSAFFLQEVQQGHSHPNPSGGVPNTAIGPSRGSWLERFLRNNYDIILYYWP